MQETTQKKQSPLPNLEHIDLAAHPNLVIQPSKKNELPPPSLKKIPPYVKPLKLSENQVKVITDKYLKNSPTIEHWMYTVAHNIALAELLYAGADMRKAALNGIHVVVDEKQPTQDTHAIAFYLHKGMHAYDERIYNFRKFMLNLYALGETPVGEKLVADVERDFYDMMAHLDFLPNSPTLMNAGRALQQLSACYVLPVGDSIEEIYESLKNMALIHKSGGGTGFSFSRLRPQNDPVQTTKGISSGPVSFMGIFDKSTDVVKQGGTRRGANMGIVQYDHPDILKFIECKKQPGFLENFNISVALTEEFMQKVERNEDYDLLNPHTGETAGKLNARNVFNLMVESAWESGDPGFVVIDRINRSESNPTPAQGMIESTNPCGEQPLLPYEPCNLGSINLSKFVASVNGVPHMDWDRLKKIVHLSIHFLDNVIDVNNYPIPEIEELAKRNRRIGLGVMGYAETIAMLGIPYNSEDSFAFAEKLMKFINDEALVKSTELARARGVFPGYKDSIYDKTGAHFRGVDAKPRHSARTTIAPTGTIGITAGLQGAGIEPFFAISYVRYNAAGIDALKQGITPDPKNTFWEVNPIFREVARKHDFFGLKEEELWKRIEGNHKSVVGIPEIPKQIQQVFLTAHDLSPLDHVRIQCAFQKYTNNAVSKTVNLCNEATAKDVEEVYWQAFKLGAKGVTIYRDGSKTQQILNLAEKKNQKDQKESSVQAKEEEGAQRNKSIEKSSEESSSAQPISPQPITMPMIRKRGADMGEKSAYYGVDTGYGKLHVHINYDDEGPVKVFVNISPTGTEISGLATALGILISKYLEQGGDAGRLIKHLNSVKGDRPFGFGAKRIDSIPHGIAKALRDHLALTGRLEGQQILSAASTTAEQLKLTADEDDGDRPSSTAAEQTTESVSISPQTGSEHKIFCPKCFSTNAEIVGGCSKPTCFDCGFSECG
jgi:ribonucleoside-diphosphate reductase alpha chain